MKRQTESKSVPEQEREREGWWPSGVNLNPASQCCVSLLLEKVSRHQKVLFLYLFYYQRAFKLTDPAT